MNASRRWLIVVPSFVAVAALIMIAFGVSRHGTAHDYPDIEAIVAPGVSLQSLPWSPDLPADFEEFRVSNSNYIVLRVGDTLVDFENGDRIREVGEPVQSFSFVGGGLAVLTSAGSLAYLDEHSLQDVGPSPVGATRLQASEDGNELLLLRDQEPFGLASLDSNGKVHLLTGSPDPIVAAAGTFARHIFATVDELYLQEADSSPLLLLRLPDQKFLGLAIQEGNIYFSTRKGVYAVHGGIALPLVLGLGGPLESARAGLLVMNGDNNRIYRIEQVHTVAMVPNTSMLAMQVHSESFVRGRRKILCGF